MPLPALLRAYRATGADPPFGDPRRAHDGVAMEGYFWRFTDPRSGRVIVALCGVNRAADGVWATVALAAHPGGFLREAAIPRAGADVRRLGAWAGPTAFLGDGERVVVDLGDDARLDVTLRAHRPWDRRRPFGGVGPAHAVPALSQYWHPHLLGGVAHGHATLGDEEVVLDGFHVYAEKNWGRGGFPERWWWGQAQGFDDPEVCVAFAGGAVRAGPARLSATAVVVRVGDRLVRIGQPLVSPVHADVGPGHWRLRGRGPRTMVELEAEAEPGDAHVLPVPVPPERRNVPGAHQHLAGRLRVSVRRGGRLLYAGETALAGLERGELAEAHTPDGG